MCPSCFKLLVANVLLKRTQYLCPLSGKQIDIGSENRKLYPISIPPLTLST